MSGDITSAIINGAAQGHLIGTSRANAQNAADWSNAYNQLVAKYNVLMGEFNAKNKEAYDLNNALNEVKATRDEYADMVHGLNSRVYSMNSNILSGNADRTKAYEYIVALSEVVKKYEPNNQLLSNPNKILSEVNFYSAERMRESSSLISEEVRSGVLSLFSKGNDLSQIDNQAEIRMQRGNTYKQAADKGIFEVDPTITPTF